MCFSFSKFSIWFTKLQHHIGKFWKHQFHSIGTQKHFISSSKWCRRWFCVRLFESSSLQSKSNKRTKPIFFCYLWIPFLKKIWILRHQYHHSNHFNDGTWTCSIVDSDQFWTLHFFIDNSSLHFPHSKRRRWNNFSLVWDSSTGLPFAWFHCFIGCSLPLLNHNVNVIERQIYFHGKKNKL